MDNQYIEDNEIGIKYLRNQLTPEEVEGFEVYLMENPEVVEDLESMRVLNEYVLEQGSSISKFLSLRDGLFLSAGAFCSLFLVLFLQYPSADIKQYGADVVYLSSSNSLYRGSSENENLVATKSSQNLGSLVLVLETTHIQSKFEQLVLSHVENETDVLRISENLASNELGELVLVVPRKLLGQGTYKINLIKDKKTINQFVISISEDTG